MAGGEGSDRAIPRNWINLVEAGHRREGILATTGHKGRVWGDGGGGRLGFTGQAWTAAPLAVVVKAKLD